MNRFENKVALITGGAGAIGKVTARYFLDEGAKVFLTDVSQEALDAAVKELNEGDKVGTYAANVTKDEEVKAYTAAAIKKFGQIDVFFNNAGIEGVVKPIHEYPEDKFDQVIAINVKGVWLGLKHVMPEMEKTGGGSIIITSSVAGLQATANMAAYVTSKHAVIGTMKVAALEGGPKKIRVNTVHPGPVDNKMMRNLEEGFSPGKGAEVKSQFEAMIPVGRYANEHDVAKMVLFLADEKNEYITGNQFVVDGGMTAG